MMFLQDSNFAKAKPQIQLDGPVGMTCDFTNDPILQTLCRISFEEKVTFRQMQKLLLLDINYLRDLTIYHHDIEADNGLASEFNHNEFQSELIDKLNDLLSGYYVYAIMSPNEVLPFYLGKGRDNRIMDHEIQAENSKHYNPYVQERIREIKSYGQNPVYIILRYGFKHKEDAYEYERQIIEYYGLESLTNMRPGQLSVKQRYELQNQLAWLIWDYLLWSNKQDWYSKTRFMDMVVLLYLIVIAFELKTSACISVSARSVAEGVGITKNTALDSLTRIEKLGYIKLIFKGSGNIGSKYILTSKVFEHNEDTPGMSKCIDSRKIRMLLRHDAFRVGALNKQGALLCIHFLLHGELFRSCVELANMLGMNVRTVRFLVNRLRNDDKIIKLESGYKYIDLDDLDSLARRYGTMYRYEYYRDIYFSERLEYQKSFLCKKSDIESDNPSVVLYGLLYREYMRMTYSNMNICPAQGAACGCPISQSYEPEVSIAAPTGGSRTYDHTVTSEAVWDNGKAPKAPLRKH